MAKKNNIVSLSGGKDSTAMLLMMLERNEPIHSVVFLDTGWEFSEILGHVDLLEKRTGVKVWRLHPRLPFEYSMFYKRLKATKPENEGRVGNGWPSAMRRWCTRDKVSAIKHFSKTIPDAVQCVGYAADEKYRKFSDDNTAHRFPLQEWGITEADALQYCYDHGYRWGGLYDIFNRVSCFCCPLQRIGELKKLRKHFPDLWAKMLDWDSRMPKHNAGFKDYKTVHDMERRFAFEDRQLDLFPEMEEATA